VRSFLILLAILTWPLSLHAESSGSAAQLLRESALKKDPDSEAATLGRLPKGTILMLKGEQQNGFVEVEVELEEGASVQGWILQKDLNRRARGEDVEEEGDDKIEVDDGEEKVRKIRPRSKIKVPKDEGLLLRRDSSFFYGLQASGHYGILQSPDSDYVGMGFSVGGHLGLFLDQSIPMRFELGYTQLGGSTDVDSIAIGFFDASVSVGYLIERFELFGTLAYFYGSNNSNLPPDIVIEETSDFSSPYGGGGIGYTFPVGEVTDMAVRLRYMLSFIPDPLTNQVISLTFYFSFRG